MMRAIEHVTAAAKGDSDGIERGAVDPPSDSRRKIPLWVKLPYTAFVAVLVPYYWQAYGPLNFLYFCDVALLLTLVAVWTESRLLASMQGVAILFPQALWVADFVTTACGGRFLGMTEYMFNPNRSLFVRGLSGFHGWLPFLLVGLIWRLGYDRRAFWLQTACGLALLTVCYLFTPPPPAPPSAPNAIVNVNYVFGLRDDAPQSWMPPLAWFATLLVAFPVVLYLPVHLILNKFFGETRHRNGATHAAR
jgi:hypothetical protein